MSSLLNSDDADKLRRATNSNTIANGPQEVVSPPPPPPPPGFEADPVTDHPRSFKNPITPYSAKRPDESLADYLKRKGRTMRLPRLPGESLDDYLRRQAEGTDV